YLINNKFKDKKSHYHLLRVTDYFFWVGHGRDCRHFSGSSFKLNGLVYDTLEASLFCRGPYRSYGH
ncbi:MAG: hypothetical protein VXW15_05065, partial [Bdellovibrionota bacterium]|nr:hypothetical protein [Bdellovibrionota bacterium]